MANNTLQLGFVGLDDIVSQRVSSQNESRVFDAVIESAKIFNDEMMKVMKTFIDVTELAKELIELPGSGESQPLDEWGNPQPVAPGAQYNVAYPIFGTGTAYGDNMVSRAYMTVEEANRYTLEALSKLARWVRRQFFGSILDNVAWTFTDKATKLGDLTIQPLAIASDGVTYTKSDATSGTAEHYLASASAIADATNHPKTAYDLLRSYPGQADGPVIVFTSTSLVASIRALTGFVPVIDPSVVLGSASNVLVGNIDGLAVPGEVIGKLVNGPWIVEWKAIPSGYFIAHAVNGGAPVKMREHIPAELKGIIVANHSPDGNLKATQFRRFAGFGVARRVSACVFQVGSASYTIPTGFDAPLQG